MSEALSAYITAIGVAAQWQHLGADWTPDLLVTAVDREFCLFLEESATQQAEQYRTHFASDQWTSAPIVRAAEWVIQQWARVLKMIRQWLDTKLVPFVETATVELEGYHRRSLCPLVRQHFLHWWNQARDTLHASCCVQYRARYEKTTIDRLRDWPSWVAFVLCCLECYWRSAVFTGNARSSMCVQVAPLHTYFGPVSSDQQKLPLHVAFSPPFDAARQVAEAVWQSPETEPWAADDHVGTEPRPPLAEPIVSYGPIRARSGRIVPVLHSR